MSRTNEEIVQTIHDLIETRIQPAVSSHGGKINFVSYDLIFPRLITPDNFSDFELVTTYWIKPSGFSMGPFTKDMKDSKSDVW